MSLKSLLIGKARSLGDNDLFHKVSLIAVFAWVGLGADGLSSSCYGPEETVKALGIYPHLSLFVALASVVTIIAICASYSQIISCFPTGGGGYLVASKLLSPTAGVISGCALLIDYVLTVTTSVASGADALFSLFPANVEQHVLLLGTTVLASWLVTHTLFAFRYAHEYYADDAGGPDVDGGLEFPGGARPDYWDFVYFSAVLGMTFQVSDVQITSRKLRRLATVHGFLSFGFNTVILALAVNIGANLI